MSTPDKKARSAAAKQAWARRKAHEEGEHTIPLEVCSLCVRDAMALLAASLASPVRIADVNVPNVSDDEDELLYANDIGITDEQNLPAEPLLAESDPPLSEQGLTAESSDADSEDVKTDEEKKPVVGATQTNVVGESVMFQFPDEENLVGELVVYHFVNDGFTKYGKLWYRGEEIKFDSSSARWQKDRHIFELTAAEQEKKWGKELFRPGSWQGERFEWSEEAYEKALSEHDRDAIARLEQAKKAPKTPFLSR